MIYTCALVEDEPLAEMMLRKYINRISFLELVWTCTYAEEAVRLLQKHKIDILFLDLQTIPVRADSSFYYLVQHSDRVIVTSPYPQEAVGAELPVVAFLHKPIGFEHFLEAIESFLADEDS